jgi:hypothetical protein
MIIEQINDVAAGIFGALSIFLRLDDRIRRRTGCSQVHRSVDLILLRQQELQVRTEMACVSHIELSGCRFCEMRQKYVRTARLDGVPFIVNVTALFCFPLLPV